MFQKFKKKIMDNSNQTISDFITSATSTTTNNHLFTIADDDTIQMTDPTTNGEPNSHLSSNDYTSVPLGTPVTSSSPTLAHDTRRRNSNTSIASDVSFLPKYETTSPSYRLQADMDLSDDNMSVASASQSLNSSGATNLSKEQIYGAYRKAQAGYHKYRGRFRDLTRYYQALERDISKLKAVLAETQDKALRRVNELKEQCALEQKAKAHLETALRDDIDERQLKISSLETKIKLLQQPSSDAVVADLKRIIEELKAKVIVHQTHESDLKIKISRLEKEVQSLMERERENNLSVAQSKMELHNELLQKEEIIKSLNERVLLHEQKTARAVERVSASTQVDGDHINHTRHEDTVLLRQELDELRTFNEKLTQQNKEYVAGLQAKEAQLAGMEKSYRLCERRAEEVATQLRTDPHLQQRLIEMETHCQTLQEQIRTLTADAKYSENDQRLTSHLEDNDLIKELRSENDNLLKQQTELKEHNLRLTERVTSFEEVDHLQFQQVLDENARLTSQNSTLKSKLDVCEREKAETLCNLQASIDKHEKVIKDLSLCRLSEQSLNEEIKKLRSQLDDLDAALDQKKRIDIRLAEALERVTALEQDLARSNDHNDLLEAKLNSQCEAMMKKELEESARLLKERECAQQREEDLANEIKVLESRLENVNKELAILRRNNEELGDIVHRNSELQRAVDQHLEENRILSAELERLDQLMATCKRLQAENSRLTMELDQEKQVHSDENQKISEQIRRLENTNMQLMSEKTKHEECEKERRNDVEKELAQCRKELDMLRSVNQSLEESNAKLSSECDNLLKAQQLSDQLNMQNTDLQNQLIDISSELVKKSDYIALISESYEQCNAEYQKYKSEMDATQQEYNALREQAHTTRMKLLERICEYEDTGNVVEVSSNDLLECFDRAVTAIIAKYQNQLDDVIREKNALREKIVETNETKQDANHSNGIGDSTIVTNGPTEAVHVADVERPNTDLVQQRQQLERELAELKAHNIDRDATVTRQIDELNKKVAQYKAIDALNRQSIEFFKAEMEKMQSQKDKLSRTLDETLVTLNHCNELVASGTEIEYLRHVLFNYMIGKESLVLARVIAAVCKFNPTQTEIVLQREQQKQSLLGQLGIL